MERKDAFFIALILLGIAALIALTHRPRVGVAIASETVPDATEEVGMSLAPDSGDDVCASPFKGRYARLPAPLMGMNPSTTPALEGVAPVSEKVYH